MSTARTCLALGAAAALTITGGVAAAQAEAHAPSRFSFESQLTAIQFFGTTGPIVGFPTKPLVPGDRIIGQDRIVGHDNEVCSVSFNRDVLCADIVRFDGRGDLQASWTVQWPATGSSGPSSFDGVVDGGTLPFQSAHGSFHAAVMSNGDLEVIGEIDQ